MSARARVVHDSVGAADALDVQIVSARATVATWIVIDGLNDTCLFDNTCAVIGRMFLRECTCH
eukprot:COSAG01_NODE_4677_length_4823_cov_6.381456_3_plen_63_part_00